MTDTQASGWRAELQLRFAAAEQRTDLVGRRHRGPLLVQRPFHPEGATCHVYLIHPPGGIAGGDELRLDARLEPGAQALITTPAATKFYRAAAGRTARVEQRLQLQGAELEWLPQEAICFDQAQVRTLTRIELDAQSRFIGWEMTCYGRRACDEIFAQGRISQSLELWEGTRPLLLDHLHITGGSEMQQAHWGLNGAAALGSLLAYPATAADVSALRELPLDAARLSITLVDRVLLCRCVGRDATDLRQLLLPVWQCLRPRLLQRDATAPRIWAT
jgi:urease accessory protein